MSPESCTSLVVRFGSPFDWWRELRNHPEAYRQAKKQILDAAIGALEQHFPGLAARVEATDVATPHSTVRYTGVWRGSIQGWKLTAELMGQAMKGTRLPLTVPGLAGLALAGQWTEPGGGIPPAARSGIEALECLIRQRGKKKYPPSARARQPRD
jgi:phytoene dehydrogenase-like protein